MQARRLLCALTLIAACCLVMTLDATPTAAQERPLDLSLRLYGDNGDRNVTAGVEGAFSLELVNHGSRAIANLRLSAEAPVGWLVTIAPAEIAHLPAGSLRSVDVRITPPDTVRRREHVITFRAEGDGISRTHRAQIRVRSARWLWVGGLVVAAAIAAFVAIFVAQSKSDPVVDLDEPGRRS